MSSITHTGRNNKMRLVKFSTFIVVLSFVLAACNTMPMNSEGNRKASSSSSLVNYLYPNGERPPGIAEEIPQLTVPVRIGIAFVPGTNRSMAITSLLKRRLLGKVKSSFRHHSVVQEIRVLPVNTLRHGGGFAELRHVAQRYNVDLVALVSHNQVRAITHNALSLSYVTIVGALVLPGNNHDVSTFVNTAVFDARSGKLLFHALGKDAVSRQTSAFAAVEKNRLLSRRSMRKATVDMIGSLDVELRKFRTRIRRGSNEADIRYRRSYRGDRYTRGRERGNESENHY